MAMLNNTTGRVLLAAPMLSRGGEERIVVALANRLLDRGFKVALACDLSGPLLGDLGDKAELFDVDFYSGERSAYLRTSNTIMQWKPDVVHCHGTRPGLSARAAAIRHRCPVIWTVQLHPLWGPKLHNSLIARTAFRIGLWGLEPFTATTACVSQALAQGLVAFARPVPLHCTVVHNAIDTNRYRPNSISGAAFRLEHGIKAKQTLAAMIARLTPRKGITMFVEAIAAAKDKDTMGVIAGSGDELPQLESLIKRLGLEDRVLLVGEMMDPRPLMTAADVGVLPSRGEGLPLCVMEMLSCGLPVALSDIPEHQDFRLAGDAVSFFRSDSIAELAALLDRSVEWRSQRLSSLARASAVKHFSLDSMVESYVGLYGLSD